MFIHPNERLSDKCAVGHTHLLGGSSMVGVRLIMPLRRNLYTVRVIDMPITISIKSLRG